MLHDLVASPRPALGLGVFVTMLFLFFRCLMLTFRGGVANHTRPEPTQFQSGAFSLYEQAMSSAQAPVGLSGLPGDLLRTECRMQFVALKRNGVLALKAFQ